MTLENVYFSCLSVTVSSHGAVSTSFEASWGPLGGHLGLLGVSWGCLGALLGCSEGSRWPLWGLLGNFVGASWASVGSLCGLLGASCASWSFLTASGGNLGGAVGVLCSFLGSPQVRLWNFYGLMLGRIWIFLGRRRLYIHRQVYIHT